MTDPYVVAVLDARLYDGMERLPRIRQAVEALSAGEALLVALDREPERLCGHLHASYGDRLVCELTDAGPSVWCVRLFWRETGS